MHRRLLTALAAVPLAALAADLKLSGLVTDKTASPLQGVAVSLARNGGLVTTDTAGIWNLAILPATGMAASASSAQPVTRHLALEKGHLRLSFNGHDLAGRNLGTSALPPKEAQRIAARSQNAGVDTLLYAWRGVVLARTPIDTLVKSGILQVLDTAGVNSGIAANTLGGIKATLWAGSQGDTLRLFNLPTMTGWNLALRVHSRANGWESWSTKQSLYGTGIDSLAGTWNRLYTLKAESLTVVPRALSHRYESEVTYRNGTTATVWTTRIGGLEWFAENLNYDIPGDTLDVCYGNDPAKCATIGRYYTAAQALNLLDAKGKLNHDCDTLPNVGREGAACPTIDPQGVCPAGWHLPTSEEWNALTLTTDAVTRNGVSSKGHLYGGDWTSFTGADWYGFNLQPSLSVDLAKNQTWAFGTILRAALWASTPSQDQAVSGTAFQPADSYYGSHSMWYYNPSTSPRERAAYPVRCVRTPVAVHLAHDTASLDSLTWSIASAATGDTLTLGHLPVVRGWETQLEVHSKSSGWASFTTSLPLAAAGVDSLRAVVVDPVSGETMILAPRSLDHRFAVNVTYRDGSAGSVKAVRIGGTTWMAENLNYDIPGDTLDVCYGNDPAKCASMGRYYTAAQALNLLDTKGKLNHDCDTLPNVGREGAVCPTIDPQGVCPADWHLPTSEEWNALTLTTDAVTRNGVSSKGHLYGGDWTSFTGADWYGFNLQPSLSVDLAKNQTWAFGTILRAALWASTPSQDQAVSGTAFQPADSYYGSHSMWYYNPSTSPRERAAYPVRCLKND